MRSEQGHVVHGGFMCRLKGEGWFQGYGARDIDEATEYGCESAFRAPGILVLWVWG
jgi:hypothetical protein